ncbi:hypothetical protein GV828_05830 [Flavobacterium sp. NST-5]|uniref:Uncharacterized protein n=1 Tax=Flavobacterium ichthyis TaxID=2698827 RepID=A0ABW9Z767_9FLAO|nr:hypothetical protein [Flavobacterium ichthyis]NBL64718.1 hypothetical protein [Flavobacterium ichthyis]
MAKQRIYILVFLFLAFAGIFCHAANANTVSLKVNASEYLSPKKLSQKVLQFSSKEKFQSQNNSGETIMETLAKAVKARNPFGSLYQFQVAENFCVAQFENFPDLFFAEKTVHLRPKNLHHFYHFIAFW